MTFLFGDNRARRRHNPRGRVALFGLALAFVVGAVPPSLTSGAEAAFPGRNGRVAFSAGLYVEEPPLSLLPPGYLHIRDVDIFTVSPGGSDVQQVTEGDFVDLLPAWSPDGRTIAFSRADPGTLLEFDIYVVEADGGAPINLTQAPQFREWDAAWSPDGRKILFRSDRATPEVATRPFFDLFRGDLFVMKADGSDVVQLTSGGGGEMMPTWSPDGKWIAFRDMDSGAIGLIKPDGSRTEKQLLSTNGAFAPEWSPDGTRILFQRNVSGSADVWVVDLDRPQFVENLTPDTASDDLWPAWSPDGKHIAFVSDRDGTYRLYKMRADGSGVERLVDIELPGDAPFDWGPRP